MLFTYKNDDPTYTLAPTVGWTVIEISAGIISACLPTLLPVIRLLLKTVGIKRNFFSSHRGTNGASNVNKSNLSSRNPNKSMNADSTHRTNGNDFYRLNDETESDGSFTIDTQPVVMNSQFRPDTKGYRHATKSLRSDELSANLIRDDIPLNGIRVQTEFKQITSSK